MKKETIYKIDLLDKKIDKRDLIKIIENLQSENTIYSIILDKFPDDMKGKIAEDKWHRNGVFRYGTEYGMLAMLHWLITNDKVKITCGNAILSEKEL